MRFFDYVRGLYTVETERCCAHRLLSLLTGGNIPFKDVRCREGTLSFSVRPADIGRVRLAAERLRIEIKTQRGGFPRLLYKYRRRMGIPIGALLCAVSLFVSSNYVWDINIVGNEEIPTEVIMDQLAEQGLYYGAKIKSLDKYGICGRVVLENEKISWLSINMRGTVATVELRETKPPHTEEINSPSNIVASLDGQIVSVKAEGGRGVCKSGDIVKKGDILISGIMDSKTFGYRAVRARGSVLARVTKEFSTVVSRKSIEKIYSGREKTRRSIKIFSKSIILFKNTNTSFEKYDTIKEEKRLTVFGVELPVFVYTEIDREYEEREIYLDDDGCYSAALSKLESSLAELEGDTVLSRSESALSDSESYVLKITVECITDIADERKIITEK